MGSTVLFIARRTATSIALLALTSVVIFVVMRVIPGDPTITKLGGSIRDLDPQTLRDVRHQLGLDHSLPVQYEHWVAGMLHGNFGLSYFSQYPVTTLVSRAHLPDAPALVDRLRPRGLVRRARGLAERDLAEPVPDAALSGFTAIGMATPTFVLGILLIVAFSVKLDWLPAQGYVSIEHDPVESMKAVLLPAITLAIGVAAPILRILRTSLAEVDSAAYIRTAAGKGMTRRQVVFGHMLPNAMIPALTMIGVILGTVDRRDGDRRVRVRASRARDADGRLGAAARLPGAAGARPLRCGGVHPHEPRRRHPLLASSTRACGSSVGRPE